MALYKDALTAACPVAPVPGLLDALFQLIDELFTLTTVTVSPQADLESNGFHG